MKALLGMVYAIQRPIMKIANMMEVIAVMQIVRFAVMAIAIQMRLNALVTLRQEVSYLLLPKSTFANCSANLHSKIILYQKVTKGFTRNSLYFRSK